MAGRRLACHILPAHVRGSDPGAGSHISVCRRPNTLRMLASSQSSASAESVSALPPLQTANDAHASKECQHRPHENHADIEPTAWITRLSSQCWCFDDMKIEHLSFAIDARHIQTRRRLCIALFG